MELCWKPRAFHGQRQPPELCTHPTRRHHRQRDGAPLEATGVPRTEAASRALHSHDVETPQTTRWSSAGSHGRPTDGSSLPSSAGRWVGGRERERPQQNLAAMAAALFSSLPPNEENNTRKKRKKTLDAPKENDLTKLGIPLYCKTGNALTGAPPSFYIPRREGNTTWDWHPSFHTYPPFILRTCSPVERRSPTVFSRFLLVAGILLDNALSIVSSKSAIFAFPLSSLGHGRPMLRSLGGSSRGPLSRV